MASRVKKRSERRLLLNPILLFVPIRVIRVDKNVTPIPRIDTNFHADWADNIGAKSEPGIKPLWTMAEWLGE
jgi:hypothetical protein